MSRGRDAGSPRTEPRGARPGTGEAAIQFAARIIGRASREKPADALLRSELRSARGLPREAGRQISRAVFAYYRWQRWLEARHPAASQIQAALELAEAFKANPRQFTDDDMRRAIPGWAGDFMEVSPEWLRALQAEPVLWLRARPGQGIALSAQLRYCAAPFWDRMPEALRYSGEEDLFRTAEFQAGQFELQDVSSQAVGLLCAPKPGETWWDACAGEGGKLLHLCDLLKGKGLVWASDRAEWRLRQLRRRAARAGVFNYRGVLWREEARPPTRTKFDGILVDAPCSGMGAWHRNPQARWTCEPGDIGRLAELQQALLATAIPALKPGGRLIYSVCTLTRNETAEVAERVAREHPELRPLPLVNPLEPNGPAAEQVWLWPQRTGGGGMFVAGWAR